MGDSSGQATVGIDQDLLYAAITADREDMEELADIFEDLTLILSHVEQYGPVGPVDLRKEVRKQTNHKSASGLEGLIDGLLEMGCLEYNSPNKKAVVIPDDGPVHTTQS